MNMFMVGRTEAETYELCTIFEELGFDGIHISNGSYASPGNKSSNCSNVYGTCIEYGDISTSKEIG